jgi:hypothetical protein
MKPPFVDVRASLAVAAALGALGCSSATSPDAHDVYGKVTAVIDGVAWQSIPIPIPIIDSTIIAHYAPATGRLWIVGYGSPPPGGGAVEELSLCVPANATQHRYALGAEGAGPYGFWSPAAPTLEEVVRFMSGVPAGTLTIEEYDQVAGTIRGGFNFTGKNDSTSQVVRVTGRFYGRMAQASDAEVAQACHDA